MFHISKTTVSKIETSFKFAQTIPLQSNDAFIAAAYHSANLLTFDNDFKKVTLSDNTNGKEIKVFTLKMTNNFLYGKRSHRLMNTLDPSLKEVVVQAVGGHDQFSKKFGWSKGTGTATH